MLKDVLDLFEVCIIVYPNKAHFFHNRYSLHFTYVSALFKLKLSHHFLKIIFEALHQDHLRACEARFIILPWLITPISLRSFRNLRSWICSTHLCVLARRPGTILLTRRRISLSTEKILSFFFLVHIASICVLDQGNDYIATCTLPLLLLHYFSWFFWDHRTEFWLLLCLSCLGSFRTDRICMRIFIKCIIRL